MSESTIDQAPLPTSGFTVTHYLRPGGDALGWTQYTSAELSADDAVQLIRDRAAEAAGLGFTDPVAEAQPDPTAAPAADAESPSTGDGSEAVSTIQPSGDVL